MNLVDLLNSVSELERNGNEALLRHSADRFAALSEQKNGAWNPAECRILNAVASEAYAAANRLSVVRDQHAALQAAAQLAR